VIEPRLK